MVRLQYGVGEVQHLGKLAGSEVKSGMEKHGKGYEKYKWAKKLPSRNGGLRKSLPVQQELCNKMPI